eukprot:14593785-Heterocapsa_arctica.AAC.1
MDSECQLRQGGQDDGCKEGVVLSSESKCKLFDMNKKKACDTYSDQSSDNNNSQLYWLKDKSHDDLIGLD